MKNVTTRLWLTLVLPLAAQTPAGAPQTVTATAGAWTKTVTLPAEAGAYHRIRLGTAATGWVRDVHADIGSRVKKGDLLAEIDAPDLTAAAEARAEEARAATQRVTEAAALVRSAEALARAAKSEADRLIDLASGGTVTSKVRDEAEARAAAAQARIAEAEAAIAAAEAEALAAKARQTEAEAALAFTRITAPFDGLVVARHANPGEFLGEGSPKAELFVVEQTEPLRVRLHVPEHAAALTGAGDPVRLQLGGLEIPTRLSRVSGSLDPTTRTLAAEVDLPNTSLTPGTFGTATVTTAHLENAVFLPLSAVRTAEDGSRFVLISGNPEPSRQPVTLFAVDGTQAILSAGPPAGSQVVLP